MFMTHLWIIMFENMLLPFFFKPIFTLQEVRCNKWKVLNYFYTALNPVATSCTLTQRLGHMCGYFSIVLQVQASQNHESTTYLFACLEAAGMKKQGTMIILVHFTLLFFWVTKGKVYFLLLFDWY